MMPSIGDFVGPDIFHPYCKVGSIVEGSELEAITNMLNLMFAGLSSGSCSSDPYLSELSASCSDSSDTSLAFSADHKCLVPVGNCNPITTY